MTITIAPPTCAVVFDAPTIYVDRNLATASWWDKYEIQPGAYPFEWTRNGKPWNADPDAITPGFIANVGPQDATAYMQARLVESYRENRILHHVTADQRQHADAALETLARRVYAFQVPGCPKPPHGTPIKTFLGGRVERIQREHNYGLLADLTDAEYVRLRFAAIREYGEPEPREEEANGSDWRLWNYVQANEGLNAFFAKHSEEVVR